MATADHCIPPGPFRILQDVGAYSGIPIYSVIKYYNLFDREKGSNFLEAFGELQSVLTTILTGLADRAFPKWLRVAHNGLQGFSGPCCGGHVVVPKKMVQRFLTKLLAQGRGPN